ncbi:ly6/PLAUR domain-containing protein 3-like isoform X2 [Pleurodeles waltl]|uniref:ly6/PLAUR domain-containing protein 3-like isoform X2 n=1 Tax=Pleurodeles waltl TaxID=8319 RepID=UPI00370991B9
MEAGKLAQVLRKVAVPGMLMAVLLAQGVASLRCYTCLDINGEGCTADQTKIEDCTPPRNVCLEAITVVTVDKQHLSVAKKGCDVGPQANMEHSTDSHDNSYVHLKVHACSDDLCNTLLTKESLHKPQANQTGNQHSTKLRYFMKKCSNTVCTTKSSDLVEYANLSSTGSCCQSNLCNGLVPTTTNGGLRADTYVVTTPNAGLRADTYVVPLIVAALVAITSI